VRFWSADGSIVAAVVLRSKIETTERWLWLELVEDVVVVDGSGEVRWYLKYLFSLAGIGFMHF
jgi:hypothetical protein